MDSPAGMISATENALRELVASVLTGVSEEEWEQKGGVSAARVQNWRDRRKEELKKRTSVLEQTLIYFADLPDLGTIIRKNWDVFVRILGNRKAFDVDMDRLEAARITVAHGRELLAHEVADVAGISGRFRNAVTIYRTASGAGGREYFPRIEEMHDSLGLVRPPDNKFVRAKAILRVGDHLEVSCRGWDPDGVPFRLEWRPDSGDKAWQTFVDGFTWDVTESDIGELTGLQVQLTSERSYHRHGRRDDWVAWVYTVLPKL